MVEVVPPVTVAVTVPEASATLTPQLIVALAREVGREMIDLDRILATLKVSAADYEKLKANEVFRKLVDAARTEWHSSDNTGARNQIEAAFTFEQAQPYIYARMISGKEPLNHVVEAAKLLADVAGIKKPPTAGAPTERFQITINLGADTQLTYDLSKGDPTLALPAPDEKEERV